LVHVAGRTTKPELIEEEIWQARGGTYSTGFGGGLAGAAHANPRTSRPTTIVILKSRQGIEWGSVDGQPVRVAILLAIRGDDHGKEHLKVFAKLSRRWCATNSATGSWPGPIRRADRLCAYVPQRLGACRACQ